MTEVISVIASNSRTPVERKGDLKAQVAANITARETLEIIENMVSLVSLTLPRKSSSMRKE